MSTGAVVTAIVIKILFGIALAFLAWLVYGEWFCAALLKGWSGRNREIIVQRGLVVLLLFGAYFGYGVLIAWGYISMRP